MKPAVHPHGDATRLDQPSARRSVAIFAILTVVLTALSYLPLLVLEQGVAARRQYIIMLMWSPGIAALAAVRLSGLGFASLGWRWPSSRWLAWGYLLPVAYAGLAYGIVWACGLASFAPPQAIQRFVDQFGWSTQPAVVVAFAVAVRATAGFVTAASSALGEEIGWRGFLAPLMADRFGAARGSLVVGVIWLLWHVPLVLAGGYNNGTEFWVGIGCFGMLVIAGSVVGMWLRLRSGSVWPCVAWHASHNLFIQSIYGALSGDEVAAKYLLGEFGIAVPAVMLLVAIPLYRSLSLADRRARTAAPA